MPYRERIDILSNGGSNNDIPVRSETDETRVFGVISNLFPKAFERGTGIKPFYFQVKENFGVILDNDLWIPSKANYNVAAFFLPPYQFC